MMDVDLPEVISIFIVQERPRRRPHSINVTYSPHVSTPLQTVARYPKLGMPSEDFTTESVHMICAVVSLANLWLRCRGRDTISPGFKQRTSSP